MSWVPSGQANEQTRRHRGNEEKNTSLAPCLCASSDQRERVVKNKKGKTARSFEKLYSLPSSPALATAVVTKFDPDRRAEENDFFTTAVAREKEDRRWIKLTVQLSSAASMHSLVKAGLEAVRFLIPWRTTPKQSFETTLLPGHAEYA